MALESATYISDLVPTNPAHTDLLSQADGHLRLIKQVIQNTFPSVNNVVSANDSDLSAIAHAGDTGTGANPAISITPGVLLAPPTVNIGTNATVAGTLAVTGNVSVAGTVSFTGTLGVTGNITATGSITPTGAYAGGTGQLVPQSAVVLWPTTLGAVPAGYVNVNAFISIAPPTFFQWVQKT